MRNLVTYVCVLFLMFYGCNTTQEEKTFIGKDNLKPREIKFSDTKELIEYFDKGNSAYARSKTFGEINYTCKLLPIEYIKAKESRDGEVMEIEELQYFDLRIFIEDFQREFIKYDLEDVDEYKRRINYSAFEMQNDIYLVEGQDTLPCVLFHFERSFDVTPFGHFNLAFEKGSELYAADKQVVFNDRLFYNGTIKFLFKSEDVNIKPVVL